MTVAYWLFIQYGRPPGEYLRLPAGEREISRMFYQEYLEDLRRREAQWRVQRH